METEPTDTPTGETRLALVRRARRIDRILAETYPYAVAELDFETPFELLVATVLALVALFTVQHAACADPGRYVPVAGGGYALIGGCVTPGDIVVPDRPAPAPDDAQELAHAPFQPAAHTVRVHQCEERGVVERIGRAGARSDRGGIVADHVGDGEHRDA